MKVSGAIARMALAGAARSIKPVELLKPFNWMVRNVRKAKGKRQK
jgi:hypothetical protein